MRVRGQPTAQNAEEQWAIPTAAQGSGASLPFREALAHFLDFFFERPSDLSRRTRSVFAEFDYIRLTIESLSLLHVRSEESFRFSLFLSLSLSLSLSLCLCEFSLNALGRIFLLR